jgi:hypothetical protein
MEFQSTAVKPYHQLELEEKDDNQGQNDEELDETNDLLDVPCWNPQRYKQPPTRFRQNIADITVYLGNCTDSNEEKRGNNEKVWEAAKTPESKKRGKTATTPETLIEPLKP